MRSTFSFFATVQATFINTDTDVTIIIQALSFKNLGSERQINNLPRTTLKIVETLKDVYFKQMHQRILKEKKKELKF